MLASGTKALMTFALPRVSMPLHLAAPAVQVADDVAHVFLRRHHLDLHDRLEQLGAGLLEALAHRRARRDLEGQHRRVDVVIGAVDQRDLEVDHREAGQRAVSDRLMPFSTPGMYSFGTDAADDLALEL
jgi:hypothetical protein